MPQHETLPDPPERLLTAANDMTARARWYLGIASVRHILVGGFALAAPESFRSTSFLPILSAAPLWLWGLIFLGIACAYAAISKHEPTARLGMAWSATSTLLVGVGLLLAVFTHQLSSPTGPIVWLAIALKDFVVCAQPIRSPFEGLAERLALFDRAAYQSQRGTVLGGISDSDLWNLIHVSVIALLLTARSPRAHQRACSWSFVVLLIYGAISVAVVATAPIRLNLIGPAMVILVAFLTLFAGWAWSDRADAADTDLSQNRT
ncbi:MAG: hypothetical protein HOW59_37055 [Nonomuraea sp.]|nr:hypothetical protein [Nonomuraea sp.]NUQ31341.1 hypothetical protein [Dermatophilaceae bacterium]NUR81095.1 hypothetical protein [Dermatophilaceae bacterium]